MKSNDGSRHSVCIAQMCGLGYKLKFRNMNYP